MVPAGKSELRREEKREEKEKGGKKNNKNRELGPARELPRHWRTDVVYFHARLTSALKHSVEKSDEQRDVVNVEPAVRIGT